MPTNDYKPTRRGGSHFAQPGDAPANNWTRRAPADDNYTAPAARSYSASPARGARFADDDRPASVPTAAAGSFGTIRAGQGAVVTTRDTASEAANSARATFEAQGTGSFRLTGANRPQVKAQDRTAKGGGIRFVIGVIIAAVALLGGGFFLVHHFFGQTEEPEETSTLVEQTQVSTTEGIDYGGYVYSIAEQDGHYVLARTAAGSTEPLTLVELDGEPLTLVLFNGVFYMPENLNPGWDVYCYTMGDGSVPFKLADMDGNEVGGSGTLESAALEDNRLVLTETGGASQTIELA